MSIDKAKKLKALAERGYKAEKTTARKILLEYMKKHDLTFEMLDDTRTKEYVFKYFDGQESLLIQVICKVVEGAKVYGYKVRSNKLIVECTEFDAVEIKSMYAYYSNLYKEELEVFMMAFIHKNNLYGSGKDRREPTPEEKQRAWRALEMSQGIKEGHYHKQLDSQKEIDK